jgi:hypothetical protein
VTEGTDIPQTEPSDEQRTSRGRFLKRMGVFVAAAVGAGTLAKSAFANGVCCWNSSCPTCGVDGSPGHQCLCPCGGGNDYCWSLSCFKDSTGGCLSSCPC